MTTVAPDERSTAVQSLLERLDDPRTAAALHDLLDHAELLALLATMLDGLLRRSETLTGNLASSLAELRGDVSGAGGDALQQVTALLPALRALATPQAVGTIAVLTGALTEGLVEVRTEPRMTGFCGLLAELWDPATARGLRGLLAVARALGRRTA